MQSRTQSPQALWPAVSRQERLWGHPILLPQDFCGKTTETVTEQPIKKFEFFRCPPSLPSVAPLTKKPEDSGYEIVKNDDFCKSVSGYEPMNNKYKNTTNTMNTLSLINAINVCLVV